MGNNRNKNRKIQKVEGMKGMKRMKRMKGGLNENKRYLLQTVQNHLDSATELLQIISRGDNSEIKETCHELQEFTSLLFRYFIVDHMCRTNHYV